MLKGVALLSLWSVLRCFTTGEFWLVKV